MKYFIDTEFIEDGKTIDLLSIGVVCEDGREFYRECNSTDPNYADQWVVNNVFPSMKYLKWQPRRVHLHASGGETVHYPAWTWYDDKFCQSSAVIAGDLKEFIGDDTPTFIGWYSAYDWVAICQLYGRMLDIPKEWPKYCVDLKPIAKMYKITLAQGDSKHNALEDARWVRAAHTAIKDVLWRSYKETELFI